MTTVRLLPISPSELSEVRRRGVDAHDRPAEPFAAEGGEQLRCCLVPAEPGEQLLLIGHAPLAVRRPWQEVGPVFVHARRCPVPFGGGVPSWLDDAPRVLRAYDRSGAMCYRHNRVVEAGHGVEAALAEIVAHDEVREVHVRNLLAQCFVVRAVQRSDDG
ncbi:MAG: DUF1203 domain-containing protein [Dermatophilaceae bacterium]